MELVFLVGIALLAMAFIDRRYEQMQRVMKARIKDDERPDR